MDGPTEVFEIAAPIPVIGTRWGGYGTRIRHVRHRQWWRPAGWEVTVLGKDIDLFVVAAVWHEDSHPRCEGMGSTELTWHNVRWAWEHREHCYIRWPFPRRVKQWRQDRCAECGGRFKWRRDPRIGTWDGDEVWHAKCERIVTLRREKRTLIGWINGEKYYDWWVQQQLKGDAG